MKMIVLHDVPTFCELSCINIFHYEIWSTSGAETSLIDFNDSFEK